MSVPNAKAFSRSLQAAGTVLRQTVARLADRTAGLVFPPRCLACGAQPDAGMSFLCLNCERLTAREREQPACPRCAASVAPHEVTEGRCAKCRRRRLRVVATVRVASYRALSDERNSDEPTPSCLGRLVRAYKYNGREELEPLLGSWLADAVGNAPWRGRIEAIIWVPTHWRRRFYRPLHAAERLATCLSAKTGIPLVPVLRRIRAGRHQMGLGYAERIRNVRGAFAVRRRVELNQARLLLVDDVKTSGATISECAKVLRQAGAAEVYAAVLATAGQGPDGRDVLAAI